uniref:CWH43-like N-terminal domain-containing protein n=1 Tax=Loa loa TaxID=7209 RepID=A0A1I7VYT9_LOALO
MENGGAEQQLDNRNNRKSTYRPSSVYIENGKTRARLPSLSRIINLPLERLLWQFLVFVHTPVRIVELFTGFCRYGRLMDVNYRHKRFYEFARYVYFYAGNAELFFMIGLSLLGERENIPYEVFAICEYVGVFLNIAYHGCAFYDIRYKVIFSVRLVEAAEFS